ncbi:glutathione S-transferase [Brucella tritici]|uniref:Glutathione S-transferase n=1 Tax=Brucella tritici TaxID=94626 RepID=A0A6N6QKB5_9HYPH|nr:glutathione S-transferase [Brucella tritici]KAB2665915.1 glutathione S-transferase [Brucella tritici]KAB2678337.1 glutathione S-transferase [Brucella tritici]MBJ6721148.1 glutathione S-transferase [Bacillus sp. PR5]NKW09884.1 glutathione S-transferase [Brucella tritici]
MLKIWGRINSTNVKKALWTARELNLDYEQIDVGGQFGGLKDPAYLARNPNGLIPLLEDGGTVLWESNTITRYLAAAYGKETLWIEDAAKRAQAEKWMDWASSSFYTNFSNVMKHLIRLPEAERNPALLEQSLQGLAQSMQIANEGLKEAPWFSGENFGIGDIPTGCYAYAWFEFPIERPSLPHLEDWYGRLKQRPAYQAAVMTPLT